MTQQPADNAPPDLAAAIARLAEAVRELPAKPGPAVGKPIGTTSAKRDDGLRAPSDTPAAVRMRRMRARRKQGLRYWRVPLFEDWVEGLLQLGLLTEAEAADHERVAEAIGDFCDSALAEATAALERPS